ncbi:conserved fungal protein [Diplocarpon rosae]|nr:conserved fungal protein [Diplocarpon rosae]
MAKTCRGSKKDLEVLESTVTTITALITQLQTSTAPTPPTGTAKIEVDALSLAHNTASLIRAHATKLSLLITNEPFTASAITSILRELVSGPLPGLAAAVELCDSRYTIAMSEELRYQARRVFAALGNLIGVIPFDGTILSDDAKNGTGTTKGKGSLAITGAVWQACDAVMELQQMSIAGLVVRKAEQYKATLKDALEELQEWGEEESDEDEGDNAGSAEEDKAQAAVDKIFGSQRHIPTEDSDSIRPRLEFFLKRLRLLILMYQAIIKRRFKTLPRLPQHASPPGPTKTEKVAQGQTGYCRESNPGESARVVNSVNKVLEVMKKLPDTVDELASAFYSLDQEGIDTAIDSCSSSGFAAIELLLRNWEGKEDEFTAWAQKFQAAIKAA